MNNIFYGHAPLKSGLFLMNLDRNDTHISSIDAKRCKVIMIEQLICGTAFGSYRCKAHEETP